MHGNLISFIAILVLVVVVALVTIHQLVSAAGEKIDKVVDKVQGYIDDVVHPGIVPYTSIKYPPVPDKIEELYETDSGIVVLCATIQSAVNAYFNRDLFLPTELTLRSKLGNYGLILEHSNYLIVTYRGSADAKDYARDFQAFQETFFDVNGLSYKGLCHLGFKNITMSISEELSRTLHSNTKPVIFTGHSLGGCVAILSSMYSSPLVRQKYLVTFAAPRFGDYHFNESMYGIIENRRQIASMSDFIPQFPLSVFAGYYEYLFGIGMELVDFQTGGLIDNHSLLGYRSLYEGTCNIGGTAPFNNMKWCIKDITGVRR
jgi:hypothetical protein